MGPNRTQIGRGHAQIFICRKEIVVFHLGLGDFGDLVPNKPVIASTPNKAVEASLTKGAPSSLIRWLIYLALNAEKLPSMLCRQRFIIFSETANIFELDSICLLFEFDSIC